MAKTLNVRQTSAIQRLWVQLLGWLVGWGFIALLTFLAVPLLCSDLLRQYLHKQACFTKQMPLDFMKEINPPQLSYSDAEIMHLLITYIFITLWLQNKQQKSAYYTVHQLHHSITVTVIKLCARMSTFDTSITISSIRSSFHHLQI